MAAYQPYAGEYEYDGVVYRWRCYATAPIHQVRSRGHRPWPSAPPGRKWVYQTRHSHGPDVAWLVDQTLDDFSHILLQVVPQRLPRPHEALLHPEGTHA